MNTLRKIIEKNYGIPLLLTAVAFLVFGNSIAGGFLYDDYTLIVANEFTKSFTHFFNWFSSNSTAGAGRELGDLWRPIPSMVYTLLYTLFGLSSIAHHITNILLHSINGLLVYKLLEKFSFEKTCSILAAIIFLVHPVQAESVSYISGLPDILGATFILLGLNSYAKIADNDKKQFTQTIVFFLLALMTKESSVIFFPLAILVDIFNWHNYESHEKNTRKKILAVMGTITTTFIILKFTLLNFNRDVSLIYESNPYTRNVFVRLITFVSILPEYFKLIFYPVHLYMDKGQKFFTTLLTPQGLTGLTAIATLLIGTYRSFKKNRIFMLGALWFFIALTPVSGIIIANAMYFEHWLYIPIIGILIIICGISQAVRSSAARKIIIATLILIIVLFASRTMLRNRDYASAETFFNHELKYTSDQAKVYHQLGMSYIQTENYMNAIRNLKASVSLDSSKADSHFSLCLAYYLNRQLTPAMEECRYALLIDQNHKSALMTLYNIAVMTKQTQLAYDLANKLRELGIEQ